MFHLYIFFFFPSLNLNFFNCTNPIWWCVSNQFNWTSPLIFDWQNMQKEGTKSFQNSCDLMKAKEDISTALIPPHTHTKKSNPKISSEIVGLIILDKTNVPKSLLWDSVFAIIQLRTFKKSIECWSLETKTKNCFPLFFFFFSDPLIF